MTHAISSDLGRLLRPSVIAAVGLLTQSPLAAQVLELRVDGTIQTNLPVVAEHSADSNVMGYERIWSGGIYQTTPPSPFGFPTAAQPLDLIYSNKSFSIVGQPFTLKLFVDTRLLPVADLGSGPAVASYSDLVFGWFQSPTYQPFTPWLRASLTLNGITRSYVGDYSSNVSLSDANAVNPFAQPRAQGNFALTQLSSPLPPWNAGYYDTSGINLQFDLPFDLLNGTAFDQPLSFGIANQAGLSGVNGNFSLWETTFSNGQRTSLVQDTGLLRATSFSLRSFDPDASVGGGNGAPAVTPVPEPSTYGLLGALLLGLTGWCRRRFGTMAKS